METWRNPMNCKLCGQIDEYDFEYHKGTGQHRFNFMLYEYNEFRKHWAKDRNGIEISCHLHQNNNIGIECRYSKSRGLFSIKLSPRKFEELNKQVKVKFNVKNSSKKLYDVFVMVLHPYEAFTLEGPNKFENLSQGNSFNPEIAFKWDVSVGSCKIPIAFTIQPKENPIDYFTLYREVIIHISEDDAPEESTYNPYKGIRWKESIHYVGPTKSMRTFNKFPIPEHLKKIFFCGLKDMQHCTYQQKQDRRHIVGLLDKGLNSSNYKEFFHSLLWLDEAGATISLTKYNMSDIRIKNFIRNEYLEIEVPGLREKRPSVLPGDIISLRAQHDHTAYQGEVHRVLGKTILIQHVHREFLNYIQNHPDLDLDASFNLARLQYERMHQGVEQCSGQMMVTLFPEKPIRSVIRITLDDNDLINKLINKEQKIAVENILSCTAETAPYIVFGPPGTGKTITLVESILQVKKKFPCMKILICAPSNAACDMLASRLCVYCTRKELMRVHSTTRDASQISPLIKKFSNLHEDDEFINIKAHDLSKYNIVISTLHLIGKFEGYRPDFLFIDEAAQATEPECNLPIGMLGSGKFIVLAGDPKQPGPVTDSSISAKYGLGVSLLERLMETNALYRKINENPIKYDNAFLTMLINNYRSHEDVIHIPNQLFYNKSLQCQQHNDPLSRMSISSVVLGQHTNINPQSAAVEFCGILSKEQRTGGSPSYFNEREINMVLKYVKCLLTTFAVSEDEIGIIAPYIRQVHRIKRDIEKLGKRIDVGTTESFQGQEKRVMIISTVRAQHSLLRYDSKYKLGFVKNERRFNVALTRAKSKLIIIGNPFVLGYDKECWGSYIEFCQERNSYFGIPYQPRDEEVQRTITNRIKGMHNNNVHSQ